MRHWNRHCHLISPRSAKKICVICRLTITPEALSCLGHVVMADMKRPTSTNMPSYAMRGVAMIGDFSLTSRHTRRKMVAYANGCGEATFLSKHRSIETAWLTKISSHACRAMI